MPEILLFTKPGCEKCEWVKERMPAGLSVNVLNMESAEGMAEAAFYELLSKHTPILVIDDQVHEGAINILKQLKLAAGCNDI
jgi:deoxyxylulose-5-phosphate synthase